MKIIVLLLDSKSFLVKTKKCIFHMIILSNCTVEIELHKLGCYIYD